MQHSHPASLENKISDLFDRYTAEFGEIFDLSGDAFKELYLSQYQELDTGKRIFSTEINRLVDYLSGKNFVDQSWDPYAMAVLANVLRLPVHDGRKSLQSRIAAGYLGVLVRAVTNPLHAIDEPQQETISGRVQFPQKEVIVWIPQVEQWVTVPRPEGEDIIAQDKPKKTNFLADAMAKVGKYVYSSVEAGLIKKSIRNSDYCPDVLIDLGVGEDPTKTLITIRELFARDPEYYSHARLRLVAVDINGAALDQGILKIEKEFGDKVEIFRVESSFRRLFSSNEYHRAIDGFDSKQIEAVCHSNTFYNEFTPEMTLQQLRRLRIGKLEIGNHLMPLNERGSAINNYLRDYHKQFVYDLSQLLMRAFGCSLDDLPGRMEDGIEQLGWQSRIMRIRHPKLNYLDDAYLSVFTDIHRLTEDRVDGSVLDLYPRAEEIPARYRGDMPIIGGHISWKLREERHKSLLYRGDYKIDEMLVNEFPGIFRLPILKNLYEAVTGITERTVAVTTCTPLRSNYSLGK